MGADLNATVGGLVAANHLLFDEGVVDAFGHVSVRHPEHAGHFLVSRAMVPSQVGTVGIIEHDEDGKPVDGNGRAVYLG